MICQHSKIECHLGAFCDMNKDSSEKRMSACENFKFKRESLRCEKGCHWYRTPRCVFKCFRIAFERERI